MVDYSNSEFYSANVSSITTNFNQSPWWDDYNSRNNFYRILFKPGYAVQSRELTQIQTMMQEQINRFGQHVFKEGSMVLGGKYSIDTRAHYVKVNDKDTLGNDVDISSFRNQIVTGQTTGIKALVNLVEDGTEGTDTPKTLYVSYLSGNRDTDEVYFTSDEPLVSNVGTLVVANTVPVGYGSVFTINEGVRFCKEHFIYHDKQSVVIDRYDINPTCKVGFLLTEDIVTSATDSSLLDPALESSNFSAPGADRFRITPTLMRLDYDDDAGLPDFVTLFMIKDNIVTEVTERPVYNVIQDELAKRTYDESGDYYVRGFNVVVEEHLDTANNSGYLTSDRGGDYNLLSIQVEPGVCYVKGFEINKLVTSFLTTEKSTTFANVNGQIISTDLGSYVLVNEVVGAWNVNSGQQIDLYNTAQQRVSNAVSSTVVQTGNKIGTARVKSISYNSGTLGTAGGQMKIHLFDINMLGSNSFSTVRSVFYNNGTTSANVGADIVTTGNVASIRESYSPLLYYVGNEFTKTLRTPEGTVDTSFLFKKTSDITIDSGGTLVLTTTTGSETFPYGTGTLSSADKKDIFLTFNESFNIALPGTASSGAGSNTLTGGSTQFTRLNVGDKLTFSGNSTVYVITTVTDATHVVVDKNLPATLSGNTIFKAYLKGDMVDMSSKGSAAGNERTITSTPSSLSFNLQESLGGNKSGTVTYTLARSSAREIKKILRRKRYVKIQCSTAGLVGPYDLGISDVYKINKIWIKESAFSTEDPSTEANVTEATYLFAQDYGQRDDYYGHAQIIPAGVTITSNTWILVDLDYFQPDYTLGVGYFSIDSYPINDTNPSSSEIRTTEVPFYNSITLGYSADLKNHIDFRPVFTNTAADSTLVSTATVNPAVASTLQQETNGLRLPADSESMTFDYSYYLSRIDVVAIDYRGQFKVIKGTPNSYPITPVCPQQLMSLARIYIPPFPSMSINAGRIIGRNDSTCSTRRTAQVRFTMKDIGVLKQRVDNIENYVSLSLLEKSAVDMKILDENGLDRFKNGIFVDSFTSFLTADIPNRDHHICYDPKEASIRPLYESLAVGYDYYSGTNVVKMGNLLMLPYTSVSVANQPYATTIRNVETTVYRFIGKLYLDPEMDYWVNTERIASQTFRFGAMDDDLTPYSIVYGSWQSTVTGITTTDPVLIKSATASEISTSSTTNQISAKTIRIHPTGVATINSLIEQYGGAVPCTMYGVSGRNFYTGRLDGILSAIQTYYVMETAQRLLLGLTTIDKYIDYLFTDIVISQSAGTETITTSKETIAKTNTFQTTTSTSSESSRSYTEVFQTLQTETQSFGDKVIAVAPIADIRPQTIAFEGRGLKPDTKHYVYFDGQLMSGYVTPATMKTVPSVLYSNTNMNLMSTTGIEGSNLYSNEKGFVYGFLRIPSDSQKSFRTGTKEVIVTDSLTNEPDATSVAVTYFATQGIEQTVQETIISTGTIITDTKNGVEKGPITYSNTTNTYSVTSYSASNTTSSKISAKVTMDFKNISCMAYSLKLSSRYGDEGIFLSDVDTFFAAKDPNLGVWFEIRAMDNSGNITGTQVPGSEVWLTSDQVNTSDDGSVATRVTFKAPIFLLNNVEYAFVIHTEGINPNYYMFVSVLGQNDLLTGLPVTARPLTGSLFTTNNNTDWDIVPRTDLKVNFYRAKFETGITGQAVIGNQSREFISLPDPIRSGANTSWFGERIFGNDLLQISTPSLGYTVIVGDKIYGTSSNVTANVLSVSGAYVKVEKTGYTTGETCSFLKANGYVVPSSTCTVISKNTAEGKIYTSKLKLVNSNTTELVISDSNGLFAQNDLIYGSLSSGMANVANIKNYAYSAIQFEPKYLDFIPTELSFEMSVTTATGSETEYTPAILSNIVDFDTEYALLSKSIENSLISGRRSNKVRINMYSSSDYMSPIVDLAKTYTVYVHNFVNSNTTSELLPRNGGLKNKYISQVVTLADGQDAEDMRIILSAYRPPSSNSDIKVYARIVHNEDFESIYEKGWIEMEPFDNTAYSSLSNRKDWREFNYKIPDAYMVGENDQASPIVGYTTADGTVFEGFKQYQIKIGLQSDSSAIYPRVADLRCIALQK